MRSNHRSNFTRLALALLVPAATSGVMAGCKIELPDGVLDLTGNADAGVAEAGSAADAGSASDAQTSVDSAPATDGAASDASLGTDGASDAGAEDPGSPLASTNDQSPLGTNIGAVVDYSSEIMFVDAFKASRPWISGTASVFDDGRTIATDALGNLASLLPGQQARTLMLWDLQGHFPSGQYTVLYDGDGSGVTYGAGATKNVALTVPGKDILDVDPSGEGIAVNILSIDPSNPWRNVRVLMPGGSCSNDITQACNTTTPCGGGGTCQPFADTYATRRFFPEFLQKIRNYKIVRFMDWMQTNNSTQKLWVDRPLVSDARWSTTKGVPMEIILDLANTIHADPWLNVPHMADDDYVKNLGTLVSANMAPDLKTYVEYSNEVWNGQFGQFQYAFAQGKALGYGPTDFQALLQFMSARSVQVFAGLTTAFGATAPARLRRVMGSQAANSFVADTELGFQDAYKTTDAVAIAPYFGQDLGLPANEATTKAMTVDQLFAYLTATSLPQAQGYMTDNATIAKKYNVAMVAYEGGQSLVGVGGVENDDTVSALFDAVNRDPRMGPIYQTYLTTWKQSGGSYFVNFANCGLFNKFGRWGSLEYLDQPRASAPKFDVLQTFIAQNPM